MHKFTKILIVLLILFLPAQAFAYTQEIAKATPYYIHPVTGVIEDAGNNPGIGQGMTENVLHPQALVEEVDGRYFLSVRYNLANYIKNETFAVQNRGDKAFYKVGAEVTASTAETKDYRFEIPSKNVIVRATFFVGPMGRDVVFYYDLSNFTPGNTDFVPLMDPNAAQGNQASGQAAPPPAPSSGGSVTPSPTTPSPSPGANTNTPSPSTPSPATPVPLPNSSGGTTAADVGGEIIESEAVNSKMSAGDLGYKHGLLMSTSPMIQKIYGEDEKDKEKEEEQKPKAPMGPITKGLLYMLFAVFALLITALVLGTLGLYLYTRKIMNENDNIREEIYEED